MAIRRRPGTLPVISAKPLSGSEMSAMARRGQGSGLLDPTRTATDPALVAHIRAQGGLSTGLSDAISGAGSQIKHALVFGVPNHPAEPNDSARAVDLAAMFVPGAKGGGRFEGALTPAQRSFLDQIHTVQGGRALPSDQAGIMEHNLQQLGFDAETAAEIASYARTPREQRHPQGRGFPEGEIQQSPDLKAIADHLGYNEAAYGFGVEPPMNTLLNNVGRGETTASNDFRAVVRLGADRGGASQDLTASRIAGASIINKHVMNLPKGKRGAFLLKLNSSNPKKRMQAAQEIHDAIENNTPIPSRVVNLNTKQIADLIAKNLIQRRN